jgi:hypothetical protein
MGTIMAIFLIGSFLTSTLVIAAGMLSSRFNCSQPMVERYEAMMTSQPKYIFTSRTYPVEF